MQLGYNVQARPILFLPLVVEGQLTFPETGTLVEGWQLEKIQALKVAVTDEHPAPERASCVVN